MDSANNRVQKLDSAGKLVASWKVEGWNDGHLKEAYIACDDSGNVYVADPLSGNVLGYSGSGLPLGRIAGGLQSPTGLAGRDGELYIRKRSANRIRRENLQG